MMKDRAQKASALRLSTSRGWLPHLEVNIESSQRFERTKFLLTDVDVLSVSQSSIGSQQRIVFDCKSGARESAIGRAFWLHGVMTRVVATHGFVVLNDRVAINRDHRISAADLNVSLVRESELPDLARAFGGSTEDGGAFSSDIGIWEQFLDIGQKYSFSLPLTDFARSGYWITKDAGEQVRKTVAKLRAIQGELDPAKLEHLALFGDAMCLFLLALSSLANRLFLVLLRPMNESEFSASLMSALYGGNDNLEFAQRIRRITSGNEASDESFEIFPEAKRLEHLVREMLQAPHQGISFSLLAREFAFGALSGGTPGTYQRRLAEHSPYAPKIVLMASEYLQKAARLPPEFSKFFSDKSLQLLSGDERRSDDRRHGSQLSIGSAG